jgi:uncharacterized membrane protein
MHGIKWLWVYLASFAAFLAVDAVWLATMSGRFYRPRLGYLMREEPALGVALLFYVVYVAGVLVLAVSPALDSGSALKAAALGALLGLVAYGTYDITNLSTVRDWPVIVTAVDLVWGTSLTAAISTIGYYVARWLA